MSHSKTILVFICIAVVGVRMSGAHLHYCFDGSEPPVSMHFDSESGLHHLNEHDGGGAPHSDVDVSLSDDTLVKKYSVGGDLLDLLIVLAVVLCMLPFVRQRFARFNSFPPLAPRWAHARPPLRGPPL